MLLHLFVLALYFPSEWLVNQHRDSAASYIGHYNLLDFFALVENEPKARVRFNLLQVNQQSADQTQERVLDHICKPQESGIRNTRQSQCFESL